MAIDTEAAPLPHDQFDLSLTETFELICRHAQEVIGVDHSGFVRFDPLNETGRVVADYPQLLGLVGEKLRLLDVPAEQRLLNDEEPLIIKDVDAATDLGEVQELLQRYGIKSSCIVKVRLNDVVIGSFSLDWREEKRVFTDEQVAVCRSFAAFASELVRARQLAGWLESFHHATKAVTSERQLNALLLTIIEQAKRLFNTQQVGLYQRSPDDYLDLVAYSDENLKDRRLKKPEGMAWQLILSGKPFLRTTNYDTYKHRAPGFEHVFGSVLEVPLIRQNERIGVIFLADVAGRVFTPFDAQLLRHFADIATIALQQTSLVDRMRTLSAASTDISAHFDLDSLDERLTSIADHTARILRGEMCGVFLVDGDGQLRLRASHGHEELPAGPFEIRDEPHSGLTGALFARLLKKHADRSGTPGDDEPLAINLWGEDLINDTAVKGTVDLSPSGRCFSLLAMPLFRRENGVTPIGMLRISNRKGVDGQPAESIHFNDEDIYILRVFSETIVAAIQSAHLFEELKEQKDLYARLLETWNTLASEDTLVARLEKIAGNVVSITGMSYCRILLAEDSEEFLNVKAAVLNRTLEATVQWNPQGRIQTPIADWPHLQQALNDGNTYELHDGDATLARLTELLEIRDRATGAPIPMRSMFGIPMKIGRRPIGLLSIGELGVQDQISRELRAEDKNLVSSIATQAAFMIDRERRVESIQRARKGVHKLARALALGDEKDALEKIVYAIRDVTCSDIVTLYTIDPVRGEIVGPATTTPLNHPTLNVRPANVSAVGRILNHDELYSAVDVIGDPILGGTFVAREGVKSSLGTPIWLKHEGDEQDEGTEETRQRVGVLFVNYRSRHTFTSEDEEIVGMFGHLAAVTIRNKDLFERERRKARTEEALREAARVLTQTWSSDDPVQHQLQDTLQSIANQARKVGDACGRGVTSVLVALRDDHRFFALATEPHEYQRERHAQLWRMTERPADGSPTDLMRVAETGNTKLNTARSINERRFPTLREDTLSQLIVAIGTTPATYGVIVAEGTEQYGLEKEATEAFEFLSTLALEAIRAARHSLELSRSRKREEDLEDLAFAYIKSGVLVHKHKNDILDVIFLAKTLRLRAQVVAVPAALQNDFDLFEESARTLEDLLKSSGTVDFIVDYLNEIIVEFESRLRRREHGGVEFHLAIDTTSAVRVRVDADLLREVFTILSSNALRAMADRQEKKLTIATTLDDGHCRVAFSDTGKGVDIAELDGDGRYLRSDAARAKGRGYGIRTAELIVRRFGGALLKPTTGPDGTTNTITLPVIP